MSSNYNLPLLPGLAPSQSPGKDRFHRPQGLVYSNRLPAVIQNKPGIGGETITPGKKTASGVRLPEVSASATSAPAYVVFDKKNLAFSAYFQEAVHERPGEQFRIRKVVLSFFLEDGTIQIAEKPSENSGILQGVLLKRHRIPKPAPYEDEFYDFDDLNIGKDVEIYGRVYRIVSVDPFTRDFLTNGGVLVPEDESFPCDPHEESLKTKKETAQPRKPFEKVDTLKQFLEYDRKVLRFDVVWSDPLEGNAKRFFTMHYFLGDDTIELREQLGRNSGRDGPSIWLKRQKVTKDKHLLVKGLGDTARRTVLTTRGDTNTNSHMLDNLRTGQVEEQFITDRDLQLGNTIDIFGREMLLFNCDPFTMQYYQDKFGLEMQPIPQGEAPPPTVELEIPPHTGIGGEDDALQSVLTLHPKPVRKAKGKYVPSRQGATNDTLALHFSAKLVSTAAVDADREFIITYFLADDTISIYENQRRNAGFKGGKFLERRKVKSAEDASRYLAAEDLTVGAQVEINSHLFKIYSADEYTIKFMEANGFEQSDIAIILEKLRSQADRKSELEALFEPRENDKDVCSIENFQYALRQWNNGCITDHEIITLTRYFGTQNTGSDDTAIGQTMVAIAKQCFERFGQLRKAFLFFDKDRNGFLNRDQLTDALHVLNIPVTSDDLELLYTRMSRSNPEGVSYDDFCEMLDFRSKHIQSLSSSTTAGDQQMTQRARMTMTKLPGKRGNEIIFKQFLLDAFSS